MSIRYYTGRKNSKNYKNYKWSVSVFNKETNTYNQGKYLTISDINRGLGLNLTTDIVRKLTGKRKCDVSQKKGKHSFLAKYGNILITKINETV